MPENSRDGDRLIDQGRKTLFVHGFLFGIPLIIIFVLADLEYTGTLRLEEYFAPDRPEAVDKGVIYLALALTATVLASFGIVRGVVRVRRGKNL